MDDEGALKRLCKRLKKKEPEGLLAADLFAGGGGLSLGLSQAGINVVLGVDHYREAVETHAHHFPGLSVDWDLADVAVIERIASLMTDCGIDVLCGGPPCQPFSKAGRSKIRHRVRTGQRDPNDERRDLWRSFMEIVRLARPKAVIMENVPDMALDREMFIFRSIVQDFETAGYSVYSRIIDTSDYGVPQFRQRLIIVAMADGNSFTWPTRVTQQVTLWNAIGDMPPVEGGWRPDGGQDGWAEYDGPVTTFQHQMREGVAPRDRRKLFDHITRPVREDDARAFEMMDSNTKYSDLPDELKRYRDDIFTDKYKRLDEHDLSRTITAHIAKDGYGYIHPRQPRTLTVREAARIQTFPDWYRFSGGPSAAFKQIGNAVPPALGRHLATAVVHALEAPQLETRQTSDVAKRLADWFDSLPQLVRPWFRGATRWQVVVAEMLLSRTGRRDTGFAWSIIERWAAPADTLAEATYFGSLARIVGSHSQGKRVIKLAEDLRDTPERLDDDTRIADIHGLSRRTAEMCVLTVPPSDEVEGEQPILAIQAALRVAARFTGQPVDRQNKLTDGRIALARMIGAGGNARSAQLGLLELGMSLCRVEDPLCTLCPLFNDCPEAQKPSGPQSELLTLLVKDGQGPSAEQHRGPRP
ncbi:DNA cytosine methyltransferase [Enemella sp. A6]|uniref:DNA cytosine methyltransferase n=1 Tax=Enemella sp. A6 TaxID=3440152 RepID=UPI003EB8E281